MSRMHIAMALVAAVLATAPTTPPGQRAAAAEGPGRELTEHERKMMQVSANELEQVIREIRNVRRKDLRWKKKRQASRTTVIVLDPPLARLGRHDAVYIEAFHTSIDNSGGQETGWWSWGRSSSGWLRELRAARIPIRYYDQSVAEGPYLHPKWKVSRKWYQRLRTGWGRYELGKGLGSSAEGMTVRGRLWQRRFRQYPIASEEDARKFMEWNELSFEDWKESLARPQIQSLMREADERWAELAIRGTEQYPEAFQGLPDPVLLINGKYLITRNTAGRQGGNPIRNAYQLANGIIREEIERLPAYRFEREDVKWGNARRPKRGRRAELVELEQPFPAGEGIVVEWAHTYVTEDGWPTPVRWFEGVREYWARSVRGAGIEKLRLSRIPLVNEEGRSAARQRLHQEAATAWHSEVASHRNLIHFALADYLEGDGTPLTSHEDIAAMLKQRTKFGGYQELHGRPGLAEDLEGIRAKAAAIRSALGARADTGAPVFLVNGRYVINARNVTRAFQILNWVVRRENRR